MSADLTISPYTAVLMGEGRCLLCSRPARPHAWTCQNCHERVCREAAQGAIEDAIKEPK